MGNIALEPPGCGNLAGMRTCQLRAWQSDPACGALHVLCSCQLCTACCSEAEDYLEVLRVNVVGPLLVTKHFLPLLRKSSVRPKIVNISSSLGSLTKNRENKHVPMVSHSCMLQDLLMIMDQASLQHCLVPQPRCPNFSACTCRLTDACCFLQYSMGVPYQSSKSSLNMQTAILSNE